jgi:hypothetical protein
MVNVQEALRVSLLRMHDRAVEAAVDRRRRQPEEEAPQRLAVRWFEPREPDVARRCRLHLDHEPTSNRDPPDN